MKIKISQMLEHARFTGAAIKIQRLFRSKLDIIRYEFSMKESNDAARKIQRAWRRLDFVAAVFRLIQKRKDSSYTIIQKYMRGYLARKMTIQYFKDVKINGNLQPMVDLRNKLRADAAVFIRYQWKKYKARKAKKKKKAAGKGKKKKGKK